MPKNQPRYTHTYQELVKAHDQLQSVVSGELPIPINASTKELLVVAHNVLCWVLGHHDGLNTTLKTIEEYATLNGFVLIDKKGKH